MKINNEGPIQEGKTQHKTHEKLEAYLPEIAQLLRSSTQVAELLLQRLKLENTGETQGFPRGIRQRTMRRVRPRRERIFASTQMSSSPSPLTCSVGLSEMEVTDCSEQCCGQCSRLSGAADDMGSLRILYPSTRTLVSGKTRRSQQEFTKALPLVTDLSSTTRRCLRNTNLYAKTKDINHATKNACKIFPVTTMLYYLPFLIFILICPNSLCNAYPTVRNMVDNMQPSSGSSSNKVFPQPDEVLWPEMAPRHQGPTVRRIERSVKRGAPEHLTRHSSFQQLRNQHYYYLEIKENGRIMGTLNPKSPYTVLTMKSPRAGVVVIRGEKSKLFLAMNKKGHLFASKTYTDECLFEEKFRGVYFTYQAVRRKRQRKRFVGLDKNGRPRRGNRTKGNNRSALFLPLTYKRT